MFSYGQRSKCAEKHHQVSKYLFHSFILLIVVVIDENINKDGSLKEKVVEVKTSAQGFVEDHGDELDILKYNLENLIDKILR